MVLGHMGYGNVRHASAHAVAWLGRVANIIQRGVAEVQVRPIDNHLDWSCQGWWGGVGHGMEKLRHGMERLWVW